MPEPVISFTLEQLWSVVMAICATIAAVSGAVAVIATVIAQIIAPFKKPECDQNVRLDEHEVWLKKHDMAFARYDEMFQNDKRRLDGIDEGNHVTQKAMLALLSHAIDGNNLDQLKEAKKDLQEYLIKR